MQWLQPVLKIKSKFLQQEIEALKDQVASASSGNKASGVQSFVDKTTVGGYGELHYNISVEMCQLGKHWKKMK